MRNGALIAALYLTSTLAACAQPGPEGPPAGYGQGGGGQPGYGQDGGPPAGYGQGQGQGQGAPPGYAQQGWAGGMQSAGQGPGQMQGPPPGYGGQGQPPPAGGAPEHMDMAARFRMANTTHDGRLTLAQAQAGGMGGVVRHFQQIDRDQKGYVTIQDVRQWHRAMQAQRAQPQGAAGGAYPPPMPPQGGQQY